MFTLMCSHCFKDFQSRIKVKKYCSCDCYYDSMRVKEIRNCENCGKTFTTAPSKSKRFCSWVCAQDVRRTGKHCSVCLGYFHPYTKKSKYCSIECRSIAFQGTGNPNWKGGIDCYGSDWSIISRRVLERDSFTCQKCGAVGVYLEAHHIVPASFVRKPTMANRAGNLITLCRSCHNGLRELGETAIPEMLLMRKAYQTADW